MSVTEGTRREPVQERSRRTVARILDAAAALIDEHGVEAATTRAIADRAGVAYPSLYRFFADREAILDNLLERHVANLDAREREAEGGWTPASAEEVVNRELDLHIAYYEQNPSAARLWFGGRSSPTVTAHVRQYIAELAQRMRQLLVDRQLVLPDTEPRAFLVVVELGDRVLDLALRDGATADPVIVELGRSALTAYIREL